MSIFKAQTLLTITLDCGQDISTASSLLIHFVKPLTLTAGSWTAVASGTNSIKYVIVDSADLDESGTWQVQSHVVIGGKIAKGQIATFEVLEPV